jgi:hypothetical protein
MPYRDDLEALEHRCKSLEAQASTLGSELAEARKLLAEAQAQRRLPVVDDLRVAAPCDADWAKMVGDERVRFCGSCAKNVYNLSAMTRAEAQALLVEKEGELCVRYFQRADGTLLSTDCPVGVRRRRRRRRVLAVAGVAAGALAAAGVATIVEVAGRTRMGKLQRVDRDPPAPAPAPEAAPPKLPTP